MERPLVLERTDMLTRHNFCLNIIQAHTEYICVSCDDVFLKEDEDSRATKSKKSFFCSSRELVTNVTMIRNRADIRRSHFEPEYLPEVLSFEAHEVTLILHPETSFEHSIIHRIEEPLSTLRGENFTIIEKMKSVIIGET